MTTSVPYVPTVPYDPVAAFDKKLPEYHFYNNEVTVYYDDDEHSYTRFGDDGLVKINNVTTIVHIIDKSAALTQWAANMSTEYVRDQIGMVIAEHMSMNALTDETVARLDRHFTADEIESWLNDARFNFRDFADRAADIGKIAHDWLDKYIKIQLLWGHDEIITSEAFKEHLMGLPENEMARNGVMAALDWEWKHNVRWIATERKIYSKEDDYAGTMDGIAVVDSCNDPKCCPTEFKDELAVTDWKTSNRLYDEYRFQTAAYMKAQIEELGLPLTGRWLNRLGKEDGKFECWHLPYDEFAQDWQTFKSCLALNRDVEAVKERDRNKRAEEKAEAKAAKEAAALAEKIAKAEAKAAKKAEKEAAALAEKEAKAIAKAAAKQERDEAKQAEKDAKKAMKAEAKKVKVSG